MAPRSGKRWVNDGLLRDRLDDLTGGGIEVAQFLVDVMRGDEPDLQGPVRLAAALEINNRMFGKAQQRIEVGTPEDPVMEGLTDEQLLRLRERLVKDVMAVEVVGEARRLPVGGGSSEDSDE